MADPPLPEGAEAEGEGAEHAEADPDDAAGRADVGPEDDEHPDDPDDEADHLRAAQPLPEQHRREERGEAPATASA